MRKSASDSVYGQIERAQTADAEYECPEGLDNFTDSEESAWNDYLDAKDSWKASELRQLHKLVKLETEYWELFDDPEATKGDRYKLQGLIQAQVRLIGLNTTHNVATRNASEGKKAGRGRRKAGVSLIN